MHDNHISVRGIGSTAATLLTTLARQLAVERVTAPDPHLIARVDALSLKVQEQCRILMTGPPHSRRLPVENAEHRYSGSLAEVTPQMVDRS
jgi:hypothetical protein